MDRRQFLQFVSGASLSALALAGCGGGGSTGGTAAGSQVVSGRLVAPAGFTPSLKTLQVSSASGNSSVGAEGSYRLSVPTGQSSLVWLADASGKTVMLGFARLAAGGAITVEITPTTTAVALLFLNTGAYTLNADNFDNVIGLLTQTPQAAQLATVVTDRIAANSTAIDDGDTQIASAALAGAVAILPPDTSAAMKSAPAIARVAKVTVTSTGSLETGTRAGGRAVTITPSAASSGVTIEQSSTGDGIVAVNNYRRWCKFYVYRTGTADSAGNVTKLSTPVLVGGQNDLPSVSSIGLVASLVAVVQGTSSWAPVSSDPVPLPLAAGSTKTFYDIVVVGPSLVPGSSYLADDPRYASQAATWKSDILNMVVKTVLVDFFFPTVFFFLGVKGVIASGVGDALVATLLGQPGLFVFPQTPDRAAIRAAAESAWRETQAELKLPQNERVLINFIRDRASSSSPTITPSQYNTIGVLRLSAAAKIVLGLGVLDILLTSVDIGGVLLDLNRSAAIEDFQAVSFLPTVTITPETVTLHGNDAQTFTAKLPPGTNGVFVYAWSTTALIGNLSDGGGNTGRSFETSSATVTLQTTPSDVSPLTVSVMAYQVGIDGAKQPLGTAVATVTVTNSNLYKGRLMVMDITTFVDPAGITHYLTGAYIVFPKVPQAKSYSVHAYNVTDPYVPLPRTYSFGPSPANGDSVTDHGSEYWIAIGGGSDTGADAADAGHASLVARFTGLIVDSTVTF